MDMSYYGSIFNLLVILAAIGVIFYILKKFRMPHLNQHHHMKIIQVTHLSPKEKIVLLSVNNTELVIGATQNHIETLYVFEADSKETAKSAPYHHLMSTNVASEHAINMQ